VFFFRRVHHDNQRAHGYIMALLSGTRNVMFESGVIGYTYFWQY
jgi:hypothetical protein